MEQPPYPVTLEEAEAAVVAANASFLAALRRTRLAEAAVRDALIVQLLAEFELDRATKAYKTTPVPTAVA